MSLPRLWVSMMVWANQFNSPSSPSTVMVKSFWALIWLSQLNGGVSNSAASLAFLNPMTMSGLA